MIVGLTGQTGSGKSMIANLLKKLDGVYVIDCDSIARQVAVGECLIKLAVEFSPLIVNEDGTLNRGRLANIVFSDNEKKGRLESIINPYILEEIENCIEKFYSSGEALAVLDAPTLFESGADSYCDVTVCVVADDMMRMARIVERDSLSIEQARARMLSQTSAKILSEKCDYVIENNGSLVDAQRQALKLFSKLLHSALAKRA